MLYCLHSPTHLVWSSNWITVQAAVYESRQCCPLLVCRFLALERACPKDSRGRINYWHVANVVSEGAAGFLNPGMNDVQSLSCFPHAS
eukprot:scaffold59237_cov22-Tisochrysis_lutea.AAC.2